MSHRWSRLCFFAVILVPSHLFSQVIIRERVELNRQISRPQMQTTGGDSAFSVRIEWDINYPTTQVRLTAGYDYLCEAFLSQLIEEGQQYQVYSVPYYPTGTYGLAVWHYGWPHSLHVTVRVLKANEPERTFFLTIGPYGGWGTPPGGSISLGDPWGIPFTTPFFRWFNLTVWKEEIFPSDENLFSVSGRTDTCSSIQWYPTADSVTLTITAGSELGKFVSPEGVPLGSSVTRLASEIPFTKFVADTGTSAGGAVTVQASSKGIVEAKTFRVLPFLGKTLKLEAQPPIIAFGQNGGFRVEVLDEAGGPVPIPENITFKYEILKGVQWGVLFDYYTWQTGSVVEGAPSVIDFFTADAAQYEDKRVLVRVSSSDAGLTPDTAEVLILPGLLKVTVTPATLRYGERAEIVAEGVYRDGVLTSLDPSVLYSYEIVQAQDAGYLAIGSDTTRRDLITDVGPTASLIALEESPQPDSVQVIIKVTAKEEVILGRIDTIRGTPPLPPVVGPLLKRGLAKLQDYVEHVGVARVVVKKKACEDAPACGGPMTAPEVTLKELKRNEVSPDPCLQPDEQGHFPAGLFRRLAIRENPVSPFDVQACFDQQADRWRFGVPAIEVKVVLDICENNLLGYRIIDDISTLSSYESCNALHDIIGHFEYPIQTTFGYVFRPILLAHERRHKQDYEKALSQARPKFESDIRKILIKCEEADNLNDAVKKGRDRMAVVINSFLSSTYDEYLKTTSRPNYEQETQASLLDQIITMRNQLVVKCAGGANQ